MHREATRINEKMAQKHGDAGERNCKTQFDRCMKTAKSSPRAYFTEYEYEGSVACQSEASYEGDVVRWNESVDRDEGITAYGGTIVGVSNSSEDEDLVGLLGRYGDLEVCTRDEARERCLGKGLGDVRVVSERDLIGRHLGHLWRDAEAKRNA